MVLFKKAADLQNYLGKLPGGRSTGFIPTMGALHAGHISLIGQARQDGCISVCSIFVNPTQFNDINDLRQYPVTTEQDIYLLETAGADILFLPSTAEVYPQGMSGLEHCDLGYLETILEGKYRPGHFQGVCQVMRRLIEMVGPAHLYMGRKDYQQCMVVKKLLSDLHISLELHIVPTLREADGLAMSSRNTRLNADQRNNAAAIYKALSFIKERLQAGSVQDIVAHATEILAAAAFRTDYIAICESESLRQIEEWDGKTSLIALAAAFQDKVRLIDNLQLTP